MKPKGDLKELILSMKNLSELTLDLSYTALLFDSREVALEVMDLEEDMDELYYRTRLTVLDLAGDQDPSKLLSLMQFVDSMEAITDSAAEISEIVLEGIDPHPVFDIAMRDTEDIISRVDIEPGSVLIDRKLAELKLDTKAGIDMLAIKRRRKLIYHPGEQVVLRRGDILIAKGSEEAFDKLRNLAGEMEEEEGELTLE
jgi:uncharacterized protein with PhoU and TrkA domain